ISRSALQLSRAPFRTGQRSDGSLVSGCRRGVHRQRVSLLSVTTSAGTILRQLGPMVYLPTILFALGEGAVIPLIPVIAANMGADLAFAALVASALVVGQLCGNIPGGYAVARLGERYTMVLAGVITMIA